MIDALATVISAVIAATVGLATALLAIRSELRRVERAQLLERENEREKTRVRYLDPLVLAASDLLEKLRILERELPTKRDFWKGTFREIKTRDRGHRVDFAYWCNGFGAGAVTTLYVTSSYFARASRIRAELPFIQLGASDDRLLLDQLTKVRNAFGGEHNLWVELQDSLGEYVTAENGRLLDYRQFCTQLIDGWDHIWFTRLIDFFADIDMKTKELREIQKALEELVAFAIGASMPHREPSPSLRNGA